MAESARLRFSTVVGRIYVDTFLDCMQSLHGVAWKSIKAYIGKAILPLVLVAPSFTLFVAPVLGGRLTLTGKYDPYSVFVERRTSPITTKCKYCGTSNTDERAKCSSCGAPLPH